jgi:hypothetical protein
MAGLVPAISILLAKHRAFRAYAGCAIRLGVEHVKVATPSWSYRLSFMGAAINKAGRQHLRASAMSDDFTFALAMLVIGLAIIGIGATYSLRQKLYFNAADNTVTTEIDIPFLGRLKSNAPAIALCFVGLVPVVLAYNVMRNRAPKLETFSGEVTVDKDSLTNMNAVMVGLTSGLWSTTSSPPDDAASTLVISIAVPDSWPSYAAYAFALGDQRPVRRLSGPILPNGRSN